MRIRTQGAKGFRELSLFKTQAMATALFMSLGMVSCSKKESDTKDPASTTTAAGAVTAPATTTTTTTTTTAAVKEASEDSVVTLTNAELVLPGALSLVPAQAEMGLSLSDYTADPSHVRVRDSSFEALEEAGSIYCFVQSFAYMDMVNKGKYLAQVDESKCFDKESGNNQSSDAGQGVINYTTVTVESKRAEKGPLIVQFWLPNKDAGKGSDGKDGVIYGKLVVAEGSSAANPIGMFNLQWNMNGKGKGVLRTRVADSGKIGVIMVEEGSGGDDGTRTTLLNAELAPDATGDISTGIFASRIKEDSEAHNYHGDSSYSVGYNKLNLLSKNGKGEEACLSRDSFDTLAWNYNLYNADGTRVSRNSGFPIEYTDADGNKLRGNAGYYGIGLERNGEIADGATVYRVNYQTDEKIPYTVFSSNGKLMKNTRMELTLAQIEGLALGTWTDNSQIRVEYSSEHGFRKTGVMQQSNNGPQSWEDVTPVAFDLRDGGNGFFSEGLGQVEIMMASGTVSKITITSSEDVTASAANLSLKCLRDCPKASLSVANGATPMDNAMWDWNTTVTMADVVSYTWDAATLSLKRGGVAVAIPSGESLKGSNYSWGIRSGAMVETASQEQDFYTATTFYTWETGEERWNKFSGLKDANGAVVAFDAPLQITYTHAAANDADGRGQKYYGKSFKLNYGGPGQFWGIPGEQSERGYYQPLFSIASGTKVGANSEYTVKIMDGEQRMRVVAASECSALSVADAPTLPTLADEKFTDYVSAPATDALIIKVVGGEVLAE